MEPSPASQPRAAASLLSGQSLQEVSKEKQPSPSLSCKAGNHRIRSADQPLCPPKIATNSSNTLDKVRALGSRQGTHSDSIQPTYSLTAQASSSEKDDHQSATLKDFEEKLMLLAGITPSIYQRRYPKTGHTTQYITRTPQTNERFATLHLQLKRCFKNELSSREFSDYLKKNNIPENYNRFPVSEVMKFEVDVHFIFRHHPTFKNLSFNNTRPYILLFADADIRHMHNFIPERTICINGVEIFYSQNNRPTIQQGNAYPENSAAAAAAILAHERGKAVNKDRLCSGSALNAAEMEQELRFYGLDCCEMDSRKPPTLSQLSHAIQLNGSAAVRLKREDDHLIWILVDNINTESGSVRCRNPYNCEELETNLQAFRDMWLPEGGFVQVKAEDKQK